MANDNAHLRRFKSNDDPSRVSLLRAPALRDRHNAVLRETEMELAESAHKALRSGILREFLLEVWSDVQLVGRVENLEELSRGFVSWAGSVSEQESSIQGKPLSEAGQFVLSYNGQALHAVLRVGESRVYEMYSSDGRMCQVREIDPDLFPECGTGDDDPFRFGLRDLDKTDGCTRSLKPSGVVVRILVFYTEAVRRSMKGAGAVEALIRSCIRESNTAFANSGIGAQLELASTKEHSGTEEIGYAETGDSGSDLANLENPSHPVLKAVHKRREEVSADIISLLVERMDDADGIANVMSRFDRNWARYALNVVERNAASSNLTFIHELAHNMGAGHARHDGGAENPHTICEEYGHGFRWTHKGVQYRSIMAYRPGSRVPYFSGPDVWYPDAKASGKVATGNDANNNAKVIRNTIDIVSKFR